MDYDNKSNASDEDLLIGTIQVLAGKTKADPNPEELEKLKRLIRKNVPFSLRSYFMAYLLREMLNANSPKTRVTPPKKTTKAKPAPATAKAALNAEKKERPRPAKREVKPLPEGARTLYLNIGKMKRLYAKELSLLLQKELEITREDIFSLRIHDKYSFISMSEENCEKAIAKLNGMDIKGRIAAVSYSNKE